MAFFSGGTRGPLIRLKVPQVSGWRGGWLDNFLQPSLIMDVPHMSHQMLTPRELHVASKTPVDGAAAARLLHNSFAPFPHSWLDFQVLQRLQNGDQVPLRVKFAHPAFKRPVQTLLQLLAASSEYAHHLVLIQLATQLRRVSEVPKPSPSSPRPVEGPTKLHPTLELQHVNHP